MKSIGNIKTHYVGCSTLIAFGLVEAYNRRHGDVYLLMPDTFGEYYPIYRKLKGVSKKIWTKYFNTDWFSLETEPKDVCREVFDSMFPLTRRGQERVRG